ncbi:hypothetical protein Dimus_028220 [Dionaea muscipula]
MPLLQPCDVESVSTYQFVLLLSPIVSVWDCIIRREGGLTMEGTKLQQQQQHVKKGKKKQQQQVKEELDRMKLAEKKRRRLEKALATSAAIRSELEKKKQKKKEEQQRLDDEGAAIAEAVALCVLIGEEEEEEEEDSDDSYEAAAVTKDKEEVFNPWRYCHGASNIDLFIASNRRLSRDSAQFHDDLTKSSSFPSASFSYESNWSYLADSNSSSPSGGSLERSFHRDISAGLIAAQAFSSLQIGEEEDAQVGTVFFNGF